jgi:hypothetical protein
MANKDSSGSDPEPIVVSAEVARQLRQFEEDYAAGKIKIAPRAQVNETFAKIRRGIEQRRRDFGL